MKIKKTLQGLAIAGMSLLAPMQSKSESQEIVPNQYRITNVSIDNRHLIFACHREDVSDRRVDLYRYDLKTRTFGGIRTVTGAYGGPAIDGAQIVWTSDAGIIYSDDSIGFEGIIAPNVDPADWTKNRDPDVSGGKIVYIRPYTPENPSLPQRIILHHASSGIEEIIGQDYNEQGQKLYKRLPSINKNRVAWEENALSGGSYIKFIDLTNSETRTIPIMPGDEGKYDYQQPNILGNSIVFKRANRVSPSADSSFWAFHMNTTNFTQLFQMHSPYIESELDLNNNEMVWLRMDPSKSTPNWSICSAQVPKIKMDIEVKPDGKKISCEGIYEGNMLLQNSTNLVDWQTFQTNNVGSPGIIGLSVNLGSSDKMFFKSVRE